jgi:hypothetical protein
MQSTRATKGRVTGIYRLTTAMKTKRYEIPNINRDDWHVPNRPVSFLCLLRQVSSIVVTQSWDHAGAI